jgi:polar amino acid transport system substrate-binding protein
MSRTRALLASVVLLLCAHCSSVAPNADPSVVKMLAPTGSLRIAAYLGSPTSLLRDPVSGDTKGVAVDLGRSMAQRLGVPATVVELRNNAETLAALKEGRADFIFTNATPARAKDVDFSPPLLNVDQGYLVPKDSSLDSVAAVDRQGVRIGVMRGSTSEREIPRIVSAATVVPVASLKDGASMLIEGALDAFATNKAILNEMSDNVPGSRILQGAYGREALAIGIPKGRQQALPWVREFVNAVQANGEVTRAVQRAGLRGTTPAESD